MQQQRVLKIARTSLEGAALIGLLLALSTMSASASGDWLEVIVGFAMLLAIGLGGLWFTQRQLKFR
jgi:hypothetical protein